MFAVKGVESVTKQNWCESPLCFPGRKSQPRFTFAAQLLTLTFLQRHVEELEATRIKINHQTNMLHLEI